MKDNLKLTQIAVFNPHRIDSETAKALFVVRTKIFDYLINELNEETKTTIAQNHLIIAARGMGKTTLLKRIQIEITESDLNKNFIPILYQEEQYNITNLNDLWLNSLNKLADLMEELGNKKITKEIDNTLEEFKAKKNIHDNAVYTAFMNYCNSLKKRPILLLDNISLLFGRLDKDDQHLLRNILTQKKAPILIAANPTKVEEVLEYGAPFYDAFQIHYIEKLSDDELFVILNNLIKLTNSEELIKTIQQNKARIKVINKLTGGNPRTAVMLFKLIIKGFSTLLKDDLDALLDDVTPLYKARFEEELPKQAQIIMNAIANNWHPIGLKQLATLTTLPNNKLQPQLNRLIKAGWIEKSKIKGKNTLYQIVERFFNIWYLMRQSNRRDKKQVTYFSHFLESLYTSETLHKNAKLLLEQNVDNSSQIMYQLAIAQSIKEPRLKKQLIDKAKNSIEFVAFSDRKEKEKFINLVSEFKAPYGKKDTENSFLIDAIKFYEQKDYNSSEKALKKVLEINPQSYAAWNRLGNLYQNFLKDYKASENAYKRALEIDTQYDNAWVSLGNLYQGHLKKYTISEKAYKKALEINPQSEYAWNGLGNLYQHYLKDYSISEKAYKKALVINPQSYFAWISLGDLYQNYLKDYKASEKAYKKALKINPEYYYDWNCLGYLYQDCLKDYKASERAYKKAIEINPNEIVSKLNLVFLLRDKLNKVKKAKSLFNSIKTDENYLDSYYLNLSLFDLYDNKEVEAKDNLVKALVQIQGKLPLLTQDDWWRYAAVVIRLGYGEWFLTILKDNNYHVSLTPYFEAIKTFTIKDEEIAYYLSTKAVEIRDATYLVIEKIKQYL